MPETIRTYSEMSRLQTFRERFDYLNLGGQVGFPTFGYDRWLNQKFYNSYEWKTIRRNVIIRDQGCDLGINDRDIYGRITIHHMNPMLPKDLHKLDPSVLDPEYLVCVSHQTHNAIHYGNSDSLEFETFERTPGDTILW